MAETPCSDCPRVASVEEDIVNHSKHLNPAEEHERYLVPGLLGPWAPVLLRFASPQPGERVLDVACGTGIVARHVAPRVGEEGNVVGADISADMLAVARKLPKPSGARIEWREGDATDLPDGPFDLVVCQQGLEYFPDRAQAVREMRRVQAPGGRAALSVWRGPQENTLPWAINEATARHLNTPTEVVAGPTLTLGDGDELRALLEEAGYDRVEITPVTLTARFPDPNHFVMLTVLGGVSRLPAPEDVSEEEFQELVQAVSRDVNGTLREYIDGDVLAFPTHTNIAVAHT